MTTDSRAVLFIKYKKLAYKVAHAFATKYERPYWEMVDEALHALALEICNRWHVYDPKKSKPSTWLYQAIYWHLLTYCTNPKKARERPLEEVMGHAHRSSWLDNLLRELGEEGRALLSIILEAPGELEETLSYRAPVRSRRAVREYLEEQEWSEDEIEYAWTEVAAAL